MFWLLKPSPAALGAAVRRCAGLPFSYPEVGATAGELPAGYDVGRARVRLGEGERTFARAKEAVRGWRMLAIPGVEVVPAGVPIATGSVVASVMWAGLWSMNVCRIVYVVDERGEVERYGFAFGTLAEHAERGEERFTVSWDRRDGSVWYDIASFARPAQWPARMTPFLVRRLQRWFRRESGLAMQRAVAGP